MDNIITLDQYDKLVADVIEYKPDHIKKGQAVFNALSDLYPDTAALIRGTELDMFHRDENIDLFRKTLITRGYDYEIMTLIKTFKEHGKIIVGVDFDDTLFDYRGVPYIQERAENIRFLLTELRSLITLCLWTIGDASSIRYKTELMKCWGLNPDYVNESPLEMPTNKPYFNLLLDDKAGLNEAIKTLEKFYDYVRT